MKEYKKHEMGIGALINKFEQESEQNVETFNRLFHNCKLTGFSPELSVTIGEYNKTRRTVTIGDNITLDHEFSLIDLTLSIHLCKPFILWSPDGNFIGKFINLKEAAEVMDMPLRSFKKYLHDSNYIIKEVNHE